VPLLQDLLRRHPALPEILRQGKVHVCHGIPSVSAIPIDFQVTDQELDQFKETFMMFDKVGWAGQSPFLFCYSVEGR
jgi:hypothetical protein